MQADLVLVGRVLGGERCRPPADAVAIAAGRIAAVGTRADLLRHPGPRSRVLGDATCAVFPGFVDAHVHFLALARRAADVDCSHERVRSIGEVLERIGEAARRLPQGSWIRAFGYDESLLDERRAPTVAELDRAAPAHRVRLLHRTGHAAVLSSAAFRALGLAPRETVAEPGALLRGKLPRPSEEEMAALAAIASEQLLARGITGFHDLTPGQDAASLARLSGWTRDGVIRQRVAAYGDAEGFAAHARLSDDRFAVPGIKIVVTEESGAREIAARVEAADQAGAQVALHAVEGGPLIVAIAAFGRLGAARVRARRHRIEHASLCPPALCRELAECGAWVVTHPLFLDRFGAKYRSEIAAEEREWLYPLRSFLDVGVPLAFGSDAPIAPAEPLANLRAAILRGADGDDALGASQRISAAEAVVILAEGASKLAGGGANGGSLVPGRTADAVLLDGDPTAVAPHEIAAIGVRATVIGGEVAWSR